MGMRPAAWGAVGAMVLGLAVQATADIYRYRDRSGTLVFTNAPAAPSARLMRELPPASRMLVPMTREALRAELAKPLPRVVPTSYDRLIREIAERYGVEYALVKADRKSTRLNSSHVKISYAVFCLKKKKTIYYKRTQKHSYLHCK